MHYHLSARNQRLSVNYTSNALFDGLVRWALKHDFNFIHLGGGRSDGDALARFKASISTQTHKYFSMMATL